MQWTDPSRTKLPDGELIEPPKTHYQHDKHFGIDNLAHAVFLSPSIFYVYISCMHAMLSEFSLRKHSGVL